MTSSKAAARIAIRKLVQEMGMGFHPDTPMSEYVDDNRRPIFSAREAARHQAVLDRAHAVLGDEVYTVALDAMEPARQKILAGMRSRRNPSKTTPIIYVANLAAYNAGRLKGKWIEPSTDADELAEQVAEAIGGNVNRDEWAFHDYAGFPDMGEHPSLKAVAEMAELLEEHPYAVVKAASDAGFVRRNDVDALRDFLSEGYGVYESKRDYVEQMVDDMGGPSALGKQEIDNYFDYEAFGRTVAMEAEEEESERLEGMSDSEIGESVIDELYGDKIPKDLANDYFDYDAYARDVFMEVASVRTPEGLVVFNAR
jgi:antirestriction protein